MHLKQAEYFTLECRKLSRRNSTRFPDATVLFFLLPATEQSVSAVSSVRIPVPVVCMSQRLLRVRISFVSPKQHEPNPLSVGE